MIKKYKKGDEVIVRVGKDKGKTGTISKVINSSDKIVITGINISKKHQKASQDSKGGIIDKEMPMHISNVQIQSRLNDWLDLYYRPLECVFYTECLRKFVRLFFQKRCYLMHRQ